MAECKTSLCFRGLDNFLRASSVSAGFLQRPSATSRKRPFRLATDCNCFIVSESNPSRGFFHNPAATRLINLETRVGFLFRLLAVCLHSNVSGMSPCWCTTPRAGWDLHSDHKRLWVFVYQPFKQLSPMPRSCLSRVCYLCQVTHWILNPNLEYHPTQVNQE